MATNNGGSNNASGVGLIPIAMIVVLLAIYSWLYTTFPFLRPSLDYVRNLIPSHPFQFVVIVLATLTVFFVLPALILNRLTRFILDRRRNGLVLPSDEQVQLRVLECLKVQNSNKSRNRYLDAVQLTHQLRLPRIRLDRLNRQPSPAVVRALEFLMDEGLIASDNQISSRVRITQRGLNFLEDPVKYRNNAVLAPLIAIAMDMRGATIGKQQVGTIDSEQHGDVDIQAINHVHAGKAQRIVECLKNALAKDSSTLDQDAKADAKHILSIIEVELTKPVDQQDRARLKRRANQLSDIVDGDGYMRRQVHSLLELI